MPTNRKDVEQICDEHYKILEEYYFEFYALHDEDDEGCERWISNIDKKTKRNIINHHKTTTAKA